MTLHNEGAEDSKLYPCWWKRAWPRRTGRENFEESIPYTGDDTASQTTCLTSIDQGANYGARRRARDIYSLGISPCSGVSEDGNKEWDLEWKVDAL